MRKFYSICVATWVALVMSLGFVGVAQAQSTAQVLAAPEANDIYAANVAEFSKSKFGRGGDAFGLLRVIRVTSDSVIVVTENKAWVKPSDAIRELHGDFSKQVTWDGKEKIEITFADLLNAHDQGWVLEARRLTTEQIETYFVD